MNEQQLQQILTIQQAIAAAATAAVINSLLNPQQQASGLSQAAANALSDQPNLDPQQQQQLLQQLQQLQQDSQRRESPTAASPSATECNPRIQDLLAQLQQQASLASANPMALNLNLGSGTQHQHPQSATSNTSSLASPIRSPISRLSGAELSAGAATSNSSPLQVTPIKKLKTRHNHLSQPPHQSFQNRSSEATSKPPHSSPKNYSASISSLNSSRNHNSNNQNTGSSTAFLPNNVGLPRKLVRGQDVWLGRGAEQTRQILKCMWCGQSFRTLAEMTQHMKITQHYTNIISQEQITSWRQPESSESHSKHGSNKQSAQSRSLEENLDEISSAKFEESDRDENFSNDEDSDQQKQGSVSSQPSHGISQRPEQVSRNESELHMRETSEISINNPPMEKNQRNSGKSPSKNRRREILSEGAPNKQIRDNSRSSPISSQQQNSGNLTLEDFNQKLGANEDDFEANGGNSQVRDSNRTSVRPSEDEDENECEYDRQFVSEEIGGASGDETEKPEKNKLSAHTPTNQGTNTRLKDATGKIESASEVKSGDSPDRCSSTSPEVGEQPNLQPQLQPPTGLVSTATKNPKAGDGSDFEGDRDEEASETNDSTPNTTAGAAIHAELGNQKGETGDPLSALETMVEKSFDPRMRPGVANGGILQRLGIDEEVCPPWQQLNYANWYAAAAYHPMAAAALLAAGINLQNGIKLSKNIGPKKNED